MNWIKEEFDFNDLQRLLFKLTEKVKAFQGLTPAELTDLLSHAEKCSYEQDAIIVKEGSVGTHMYIIIHGDAVVSKKGADGDVELARLTSADSFGEMALADHEARSATVKALTPCILVRLSDQALRRKPEIAMKFYRNMSRVLSQRLRNANELLAWQL
jgi:CRP-like cAMP-binding protein